jgi:hypothetical protein
VKVGVRLNCGKTMNKSRGQVLCSCVLCGHFVDTLDYQMRLLKISVQRSTLHC